MSLQRKVTTDSDFDIQHVCVFSTVNRSSYPSTSSATSVGADSSILSFIMEDIQVLWAQSYTTEIRSHVPGMQ